MILTGKNVFQCHFFTTNLIRTGTASNLGLCNESSAPSHGLIEALN